MTETTRPKTLLEAVAVTTEIGREGSPKTAKENWVRICVCGHYEHFHGGSIGGPKDDPGTSKPGCRGASGRGYADIGFLSGVEVYAPTCPCTEFRPFIEIDRPGRMFRQRVYTADEVHPFQRGLGAFVKWLSGQKGITDLDAELAVRIRDIGKRTCQVCKATGEDVVPVYVSDARHSELRCSEHYRQPRR